jgi:transposase-like protein
MKKRTVKRCPQCGSLDLYIENGMITGAIYHCKTCDYVGALIFEEDLNEDELDKKGS